MVITAANTSKAQDFLFYGITDLKALLIPGLSVHLLRVNTHNPISHNTYLNLARLFASTSTVMLIPSDLSTPPLVSHHSIASQGLRSDQFPIMVTRIIPPWSTLSSLPPSSPMIVPQNFPVWCTERFFVHSTRVSDWRTCLWQLWIDSFGEFSHISPTIRDSEVAKLSIGISDVRISPLLFSMSTKLFGHRQHRIA